MSQNRLISQIPRLPRHVRIAIFLPSHASISLDITSIIAAVTDMQTNTPSKSVPRLDCPHQLAKYALAFLRPSDHVGHTVTANRARFVLYDSLPTRIQISLPLRSPSKPQGSLFRLAIYAFPLQTHCRIDALLTS